MTSATPDTDANGLPKSQYAYIAAAILVCLALTLTTFSQVRDWERQSLQTNFERAVNQHAAVLQKTIDRDITLIESLGGLYAASRHVDRGEFREFVQPFLQRHSEIQAFEWVPRIEHSQRAAFEAGALDGDPRDVSIRDLNQNGEPVTAAWRNEYFPVWYMEPLKGNRQAIGIDLGSDPARREAMALAADTGRATTTAWIKPLQETGSQHGVMVFKPVFARNAPLENAEQRRAALTGYVLGVFRVGNLIEESLREVEPAGLDFWVYEGTDPEVASASYYHPSRTRTEDDGDLHANVADSHTGLHQHVALNLPERQWSLLFRPAPAFYAIYARYYAAGTLIAGLLLTTLLGVYLVSLVRRSLRVTMFNDRLTRLNIDLEGEILDRRQTEKALSASEHKYRSLVETAPEAITVLDVQTGKLVEANQSAERMFGMTRDELLNASPVDLSPPTQPDRRATVDAAREYIQQAIDNKTPIFEWTHRTSAGRLIPCEIRLIRLPDPERTLVRGTITDISERKKSEGLQNRLGRILDNSSNEIYVFDADTLHFIQANKGARDNLGYSMQELTTLTPVDIKPEFTYRQFDEMIEPLRSGRKELLTFTTEHIRKDDTRYPVEVQLHLSRHENPQVFVAVIKDITDEIASRERIDHLAFHDALTDLPNRELLRDRLGHAITVARRNHHSAGVLFLDIDRFKTINDTLGHSIGDQLLRQAAVRLSASVRDSDTVARFGGDEFVVVAERIDDREQAGILASKIVASMQEPFLIGPKKLFVTVSIGIALCPENGTNAEELVSRADIAMYHAKDSGRNNFQFYSDDMAEKVVRRSTMENDLRCALEREELLFHCQPIIETHSGQPASMEVLMRWQHPQRGLVSPAEFIPVMEDMGMIVPITRWILGQACMQRGVIREQAQMDISVAVNFSAPCFYNPEIADHVRQTLQETGTDPRHLILEITESTLFQDPHRVRPVLESLKALGVRIALDDFGTGQSSLSHLRNFPIDIVKIDREFVRDIPADRNDCEMVAAIIAMAHSLKMKVVAEGVETDAQLAFLRQHGCDRVQGYLFSRPLAADELLAYLTIPPQLEATSSS